jgi:hypothetical protein
MELMLSNRLTIGLLYLEEWRIVILRKDDNSHLRCRLVVRAADLSSVSIANLPQDGISRTFLQKRTVLKLSLANLPRKMEKSPRLIHSLSLKSTFANAIEHPLAQ